MYTGGSYRFASIASPLNALLRKGESPKLEPLNEEQLRASIRYVQNY